ncbi:hypothetical protein HaLaN_04549, partial [Haematococcus lacustris]
MQALAASLRASLLDNMRGAAGSAGEHLGLLQQAAALQLSSALQLVDRQTEAAVPQLQCVLELLETGLQLAGPLAAGGVGEEGGGPGAVEGAQREAAAAEAAQAVRASFQAMQLQVTQLLAECALTLGQPHKALALADKQLELYQGSGPPAWDMWLLRMRAQLQLKA